MSVKVHESMQNPGDFCEVSDKKFCERPLFFCAALLSTVASSAWRVPAMLERRVLGRRGGPKRSGKCPNYAQTYQKVRLSVKVHESMQNPGDFCEVSDKKFCERPLFFCAALLSTVASSAWRVPAMLERRVLHALMDFYAQTYLFGTFERNSDISRTS